MSGTARPRHFAEFMRSMYPAFSRRATQVCVLSAALEKIALGAPDAEAVAFGALEQANPFGWNERRCKVPPPGWWCSREPGHDGPCAARPTLGVQPTALSRFNECGGAEAPDPLERLRFFCSLAMNGQDWLDVEPFFDALADGVPAWVAPVDADGETVTPERLAAWLDAKHARHGEEEDKWAADYIRATIGVPPSRAALTDERIDRLFQKACGETGHRHNDTPLLVRVFARLVAEDVAGVPERVTSPSGNSNGDVHG